MIIGTSWYNEHLIYRIERVAANNFTLYFIGGAVVANVPRSKIDELGISIS
jgi:hypothetical protein